MSDSEQIKAYLDQLTEQELDEGLPLFAKVNNQIQYLGRANSADQAAILGMAQQIVCEHVSMVNLAGEDRAFYLLH